MLTFQFSSFPVLKTSRLLLREVTPEDVKEIYELRTNRDIMQHIDKEKLKNTEEAKELIQKMKEGYDTCTGISWGITLQGSNKIIGGVGFWRIVREHYRAEIGYSLMPEHWNKGIISEAISVVVDFGFEHLQIHSMEANLNPGNTKSARVLEKAGFQEEGYFKENYYFQGKFFDTLTYSKVNNPFIGSDQL